MDLSKSKQATTKKRKRKGADDNDDTPKAFQRLMAFHQGKVLPKGLDDGLPKTTPKTKKHKVDSASRETTVVIPPPKESKMEMPKIQPGERMAEFAARVDAALPLGGLIGKVGRTGKDPLGLKKARTQKEKKMHRMYAEWREQDRKIKERLEEEQELEEEMEEDDSGQVIWKEAALASARNKKKAGPGRRKKMLGELDDGQGDPWAVLRKKREDIEGPRDINSVVLAPPTFSRLPKEKFKVRGAAVEINNVPKASGSLRRREELGQQRKNIVEGYRAMMKSRST